MNEEKLNLKAFAIREVVRAGIWGIIFLVVTGIFLSAAKQNIKEGIEFAAKVSIYEASRVATDPYLIGKTKQLIKEGIEYALDSVGKKYVAVIVESEAAKQALRTGQPTVSGSQ